VHEEHYKEKAASHRGDHKHETKEDGKEGGAHDHHHHEENINIRAAVVHVIGDML